MIVAAAPAVDAVVSVVLVAITVLSGFAVRYALQGLFARDLAPVEPSRDTSAAPFGGWNVDTDDLFNFVDAA